MQKELGQDLSQRGRLELLQTNCEKVENIGYNRDFTEEEIVSMKEELSESTIQSKSLNAKKKEAARVYKDLLKPVSEKISKLADNLKNKSQFVEEDCFKFVDTDDRMVGYYNSDGILVDSRRARPEELQGNVFQLPKTGTNQ